MNNVTEIKNEKLGESYYEIKHQSGLKILVYPKKNYASSYAMFGTRYGSIDTQFKLSGEKEFTEVPEGIAHFLEHKLFESEDLDAFQRYAERVQAQTHIRALIRPVICFHARATLRALSKFYLTL